VLLYKDCAVTALIGLIFLGSCVLVRKPVVFYMAQRYGSDGTHDGMAIFNRMWDIYQDFRTGMYVISYLWAALFLIEAAGTALIIRQTRYSTAYNYDQTPALGRDSFGHRRLDRDRTLLRQERKSAWRHSQRLSRPLTDGRTIHSQGTSYRTTAAPPARPARRPNRVSQHAGRGPANRPIAHLSSMSARGWYRDRPAVVGSEPLRRPIVPSESRLRQRNAPSTASGSLGFVAALALSRSDMGCCRVAGRDFARPVRAQRLRAR
jgi:hypothetical protein